MDLGFPRDPRVWWIVTIVFSLGIFAILGGVIAESHDNSVTAVFLIAVGTLFSGSIAVALISEGVLSESHSKQVKSQLSQVLSKELSGIRFSGIEYGVSAVELKNDTHFKEFFAQLNPDEELLWLDTSGPPWNYYNSHLKVMLQRGLRVRMLLLDPNCENSVNRAIESPEQFVTDDVAAAAERFRAQAEAHIVSLEQLGNTAQSEQPNLIGSLQIALYSGLPGVPLYLVCRGGQPVRAWTSFFLSEATYSQVHFEWVYTKDDCMIQRFKDYFEQKWERTIAAEANLRVDIQ